MNSLNLGLCGWNGSQASYFASFDCIEIQSTFYDLPALAVVRRWRALAPANFSFCIKAWQLITHAASSPTYRRLRKPLAQTEREAVGSFQQTDQVWMAWERTLSVARTLEASIVLFQCPKSFLPVNENLANLSAFFRQIDREGLQLAWEPRGEAWTDDLVRNLCAKFNLLHCVDPFNASSVYGDIYYWRLHGRGSYSYRYTDTDLVLIKHRLERLHGSGYLMFNNVSSKTDALRFRKLLQDERCGP